MKIYTPNYTKIKKIHLFKKLIFFQILVFPNFPQNGKNQSKWQYWVDFGNFRHNFIIYHATMKEPHPWLAIISHCYAYFSRISGKLSYKHPTFHSVSRIRAGNDLATKKEIVSPQLSTMKPGNQENTGKIKKVRKNSKNTNFEKT